jgi:hypothetical protein
VKTTNCVASHWLILALGIAIALFDDGEHSGIFSSEYADFGGNGALESDSMMPQLKF